MKQRVVALILVLVMLLSTALTGCGSDTETTSAGGKTESTKTDKNSEDKAAEEAVGLLNKEGLPIVNEAVTLTFAANTRESIKVPWEELEVFKMIEAETGVSIDWDVTPKTSWIEKKNLMIASGDWPDVFYGNYIIEDKEVVQFAADGVFLPLEDLIAEYAPNIQAVFDEYPAFKEYVTAPDGHIYSLPTINAYMANSPSAQFINQNWLDEYNLDMPTTTDEYVDVLRTFKDNAEEGEIPYSFVFNNNTMGAYAGFGAFGMSLHSHKIVQKDEKVLYAPASEEYKEAIKFMHELYLEGLVDIESFSQKPPAYKSKVKDQKLGAFQYWSLSGLFGESYKESGYTFMPPLEGPNGDMGTFFKESAALSGKGSFLITSTCENPEVAIRWADYTCTPDISFQVSQGMFGRTYDYDAEGKLVAIPTPEGMSGDEFRHADTAGAHSFHMITDSYLENVIPSSAIQEKRSYDMIYRDTDNATTAVPPFFLGMDDSVRVAEISSDLNPLVDEKSATWMLEGGIDEEWDDYIAQLKKMGVEELVDIYNTRYDEVKGN